MTLAQILLDCYRRTGYKDVPEAEVATRFATWADEAQQEIVREPGADQLLRIAFQIATVADQPEYGLPMSLARIHSIRDTESDYALTAMSESEYRRRVPRVTAFGGRPTRWVELALTSVGLRPSDASEIFIDSTSASDVQTARWVVLLSNGETRTGETTLTGTAALTFDSSLTTIIQVLDFYLTSPAVGTVTLHEDASGGTEIGRVTIGQTRSFRKQIALVPTPSDAYTLDVIGERDLAPLTQMNDEPVIPPRFHPMIGVGIRKREYEKRGNTDRWAMARAEWEDWMGQLRHFLDPRHGLIVPGGTPTGWSQLGPNFPAEWVR